MASHLANGTCARSESVNQGRQDGAAKFDGGMVAYRQVISKREILLLCVSTGFLWMAEW